MRSARRATRIRKANTSGSSRSCCGSANPARHKDIRTMRKRLQIRLSGEALGVRVVALLTAAMGIVNVLSAVQPAMKERLRLLEQYSPLQVAHGGHLTS